MNIELDGKVYEVPAEYQEKLILQLWELGMAEYAKVEQAYRVIAMPVSRHILYSMERDITRAHGKEVAIQVARPPKGADPNRHLLWLLTAVIREGIKNASLIISTAPATDTIEAFAISVSRREQDTSQGGGQVAVNGHIGERQNDGRQVVRYEARPPLSDI